MTKHENYDEFVEKFNPKKITDECYTPPQLMEDITEYVCKTFNIDPATVICPFYPGGDYEAEDYKDKVVIDNPPFSNLSKILKFYREHSVKAFLFCPGLTAGREQLEHWTTISNPLSITYENGAKVATNFVHNFTPDIAFTTCEDIVKIIKDNTPDKRKLKPKAKRKPGVLTVADLETISNHKNFTINRESVRGYDRSYYGQAIVLDEKEVEELKNYDT